MATFTTTIPGLPGGPLLTTYPININLVPKSHTRQRPGIKASKPRRSVQHGSGNPTSTAEGEIQYIVNGADGRQASYHYATDWDSACVGVPVDEVTWQAADGAGPGNMNGLSNEMAENTAAWADPTKRAKMIYIAGDLMGRSAARLGITKPEYHWTFNFNAKDRHRCPNFLLFKDPETKALYEKQWFASKNDELARMSGNQPAPDPGTPDVQYPAPVPIPALVDTDLSKGDTAPNVITADGTDFIFVSDVVEAIRETPRLRYSSSDEVVGPPIQKGERFVAAWIFEYEGKYMYLTPWWTRVRAEDCQRVSDAPLITKDEN